jgi:RNA polymerase sigma factor (sigma-70 family)
MPRISDRRRSILPLVPPDPISSAPAHKPCSGELDACSGELTRSRRANCPQGLADRCDGELVQAAAAGDGAAWNELVQRFAGFIWSISRSWGLRSADAADVNQVVWLRLVENLNRLREPERLKSWLAVVTRNECLRVARRAGREIITDVAEGRHETVNPLMEARLVTAETDVALREALEELSPRCRALIRVLAADPRPTYDEVSTILSMPIGSIGPTRQRCLECLRRQLERRQVGDDG